MKIKWADNFEDFFESIEDCKYLVDANRWKLEYANFVVLEYTLVFIKHLVVQEWFDGGK